MQHDFVLRCGAREQIVRVTALSNTLMIEPRGYAAADGGGCLELSLTNEVLRVAVFGDQDTPDATIVASLEGARLAAAKPPMKPMTVVLMGGEPAFVVLNHHGNSYDAKLRLQTSLDEWRRELDARGEWDEDNLRRLVELAGYQTSGAAVAAKCHSENPCEVYLYHA